MVQQDGEEDSLAKVYKNIVQIHKLTCALLTAQLLDGNAVQVKLNLRKATAKKIKIVTSS